MKKTLIITSKIILGILSILIPFIVLAFLAGKVQVYEYDLLKWFALLICALGFYISGIINKKTPLKFIPFLYIALLLFIPIRCFYFPLIIYLVLFATVSLLLTRKEFNKKIKTTSFVVMIGLFLYFLFSQPLVIRQGEGYHVDTYGNLINGKVIWDFSKEKSNELPDAVFLNTLDEEIDLRTFKNKILYITFWATWCKPCLAEKPELEKLKAHFKDNANIVFIDVSVDLEKQVWKQYLKNKKTEGIQLVSKNEGKTRALFELSGIPAHLIVDTNWKFAKVRVISLAYPLLSDSTKLDNFINRKLSKNTNSFNIENFRIVKYAKLDSTKTVYYTTDGKNRLLAPQINTILDTLRKKKKPNFVNLEIERKPISNKDSIIYKVGVNISDVETIGVNETNE